MFPTGCLLNGACSPWDFYDIYLVSLHPLLTKLLYSPASGTQEEQVQLRGEEHEK
jgi:hypothetical protein